ncbi:hypothetical protein AOLI_G00069570 [Acnodon oligacanthus]
MIHSSSMVCEMTRLALCQKLCKSALISSLRITERCLHLEAQKSIIRPDWTSISQSNLTKALLDQTEDIQRPKKSTCGIRTDMGLLGPS